MPRKKQGLTIAFVLDMTGSMAAVKQQAIDGYNEYVTGMQETTPGAEIVLTTFNSHEVKVYPITPIKEAMLLNNENYRPNSNTPLYDAIGQTARATEDRVKDGDRVAFVILTDGQENASKEYNRAGIFALLKEKEAAGWGIIYLGANQDAYVEAMGMGIHKSNTANFAMGKTSRAMSVAAVKASAVTLTTGQLSGLMDDVDIDALVDADADKTPPAKATPSKATPPGKVRRPGGNVKKVT